MLSAQPSMTQRLPAQDSVARSFTAHTTIDSPLGTLTLAAHGSALGAVFFEGHSRGPSAEQLGAPDERPFVPATQQLDEYFAGERTAFDLDLAPRGDPFRLRVWELLRHIPYGETRSYGDLARALGDVGLARAVGSANARNPLSIIVPCHRVVASDGSLTGYAGGLARKAFLLELEEPANRTAGRLF